jgi:hypothetical protein
MTVSIVAYHLKRIRRERKNEVKKDDPEFPVFAGGFEQ